jgi:hypothetical protein
MIKPSSYSPGYIAVLKCAVSDGSIYTYICKNKYMSTGLLSRYNDRLRAGRSGDRIPVAARFFAPVQTGPGAHPASCTMVTGSFPG